MKRFSGKAILRALLLGAVPVAFVLLLAMRGEDGDILQEVRRRNALYVGIEGDNPPFAMLEGDAVVGLDADLARALADALGVDVHFVVMGYDGLYDALYVGRVDVLVSALWVNPDKEDFRYTRVYFDAGQVLAVLEGSDITDPADLEGRSVAVEFGTDGDMWAGEQKRQYELDIIRCDTSAAALDALAEGSVDAAVVDNIALRTYRREGIEPVAAAWVSTEPYAAVVRKGDKGLLAALNDALAAMEADGRLEALIARWL